MKARSAVCPVTVMTVATSRDVTGLSAVQEFIAASILVAFGHIHRLNYWRLREGGKKGHEMNERINTNKSPHRK
jgi:hypothetical protein